MKGESLIAFSLFPKTAAKSGIVCIPVKYRKTRLEIVNGVPDDKEDLMTDFASVITSFCARLYGMRRAKRKTEKLIEELQSNGDNETC